MSTDYILVVIISFFASSLGSLLGIGGGIIMVPLFVLLVDIPIQHAVAISLFIIVATSTLVSSKFIKSNALNLELGLSLELVTTLGAIAGSFIALSISHKTLSIIFAAFLIFVALSMMKRKVGVDIVKDEGKYSFFDEKIRRKVFYDVENLPFAFGLSALAGVSSGMFGIGGGVLKVPLLAKICKVPMKVATATSGFMVGVTAAASAYIYFAHGNLNPYFAFLGMIGSFLGSKLGVFIHSSLNDEILRKVFSIVLIVVAVTMILRFYL